MAEKTRYWEGICYPENMIDDWKDKIDDIIQLPFAYCVHDKDKCVNDEHRKDHVHLIICWNNNTTKKSAHELFNKLSKEGSVCCPTIEKVLWIRRAYNYLIHDTDKAREQGKYQYDKSARIEGNCFDIGAFECLSTDQRKRMGKELADLIIKEGFRNFNDFYMYVCSNYDFDYYDVIEAKSGFFERLCKGNYLYYVESLRR